MVIGCEGLWGTLLTVCVVYPLAYALPGGDNGHFEDFFDAVYMISHSPSLRVRSYCRRTACALLVYLCRRC